MMVHVSPICGTGKNEKTALDPEKLVLDLIGDGYRFSEKVMRKKM
jgi:hypothetical protein